MTKHLFLLLSILMIAVVSVAQTDSTHPPAVRQDSTVPHLSTADSLLRDSITRHRKAIRDSLRRVRLAALKDSLAKVAAAAAAITPPKDSIARKTAVVPVSTSPASATGGAIINAPPKTPQNPRQSLSLRPFLSGRKRLLPIPTSISRVSRSWRSLRSTTPIPRTASSTWSSGYSFILR